MTTNPSPDDPLSIPPATPSTPSTPSAAQPVWGTPADQEPASPPSGYGSEPGPSNGPEGYGTGSGPRPAPAAGFFEAFRRLDVVRPDQGRIVAGVCAGLARRWGISPVAVRVVFVLVSLLAGAGLFLYGVAWMFLPQPDGRIHAQQLLQGTVTAGFVGALLAIIAGVPFEGLDRGPGWVPVLLIALVIWLLVRRRQASRRG